MRTLIVTGIAALALWLVWPSTDAAVAQRSGHSYGYCWQRAYNLGWERNTRGERNFIRRCMRGLPQ